MDRPEPEPGEPGDDRRTVRPGDLTAHPDLAGTGAAMRSEWRAEQEELTAAAATVWRHRRSLADQLLAAGHGGCRVALVVGAHRVAGAVVEVADDRVALRTGDGRVDVHLASSAGFVVQVSDPVAGDDLPVPVRSVATMRARLLDLEMSAAPVVVGTVLGDEALVGALTVGADHVEVRGVSATVLVPCRALAWVARRAR